jgi:hypothetical protein
MLERRRALVRNRIQIRTVRQPRSRCRDILAVGRGVQWGESFVRPTVHVRAECDQHVRERRPVKAREGAFMKCGAAPRVGGVDIGASLALCRGKMRDLSISPLRARGR